MPGPKAGHLLFATRLQLGMHGEMSPSTDCIAALATPVGVSAIAVVRASGPMVPELIRTVFRVTPPPRLAQHADYHDRHGALIDDVLFTWFAAPNSYTGQDTLEISSHGNPYIAQKILEDLFARGCRSAEPGEFTQRAFLNGRMDLSQAEAVIDLIQARSERALLAANQQLRGSLGRRMNELIGTLLNVLAQIEAYIDFPEEDLPRENADLLVQDLGKLLVGTRQLMATSHYGALLRDGIKTVILGEPNAGKSSLLNRLIGRERALVSPEPGTTRDYLEERINIGSHALRLIDTAGFNLNPSAIEKRGIDKTLEQAAEADLFLWVIDSARPLPVLPAAAVAVMTPSKTIAVYNKIDLPVNSHSPLPYDFPSVSVSSLAGTGLDALQELIVKLADSFRSDIGDEVIAINARHAQALEQAAQCLIYAREKLKDNAPTELVSSDLRMALSSFGEIAGKIDNERMLDSLFAAFCIGK